MSSHGLYEVWSRGKHVVSQCETIVKEGKQWQQQRRQAHVALMALPTGDMTVTYCDKVVMGCK